jgi:chromosomal replication initiation ATPase DnaA
MKTLKEQISSLKSSLHPYYANFKGDLQTKTVVETVCKYFKVSEAEMKAKKRSVLLVSIRRIIAVLLRERVKLSLDRIGAEIGCDHANVIHLLNTFPAMMRYDKPVFCDVRFETLYNEIIKKL